MAFDGSSDITLKASHVGAFALGKTGSTVANDKAVGWNWSSGAYNANIGGASTLIIHFYMGDGSCPAAQFRINYKNGGIFYRSARDGYGFEADWSDFTPPPENLQQEMLVHMPLSGGQLNGLLSEHPVLLAVCRLYWVIMTRALNKMAMVIWMFMLITSML
ncbi:hypothetical protein IPCEC42_31280 [Escherichia coli]|nr:hypothetical protein IPCEC42_31280 [Escherichia coli]